MKKETLAFASDHAGYLQKQVIIAHLKEQGYQIKDFGCFSEESCDYPDFAHPMATAIENGEYTFGISLCGTGNGICMTANKHQMIRSALCWQPEIAALARKHNNANVCSLPARFITNEEACAIVDAFLSNEFEGGRHLRRIQKMPLK